MSFICAIWAEEKAHKTTVALSWPKPLVHFDIDVGGFARASWRIDLTGIESKSYFIQINIEDILGVDKTAPSIRFPKRVIGYKECWEKIIVDYVNACKRPEVKTIVMDSATQLWQICHKNELQIKQEIQKVKSPQMLDADLREKLQPVEYPNDRMRSLIYTARSYGKNLVLTHYPRDIYVEKIIDGGVKEVKSGKLEIDGFKETERLVDIVLYNKWEQRGREQILTTTITKCGLPGLGTLATGLPLPESSYHGLVMLAESMGAKID
jgi:hypothetical protein